jgi:phage shock protein PspC (stress-responsive transcriptional regulator)
LAEYFNIDPTIVRLLFVLAAVAGIGGGVLIYIIMMIFVPDAP